MIIVQPQQNIENISKPIPKPLSKTLKCFFVLLQIIFSLDFGFVIVKSKKHRIIIKIATVTFAASVDILCFILMTSEMTMYYVIFYSKYLVEHLVYVLILSLIPQHKSLYNFLEHLQWIDRQLDVNRTLNLNLKIICWSSFCFLFKIIITLVYCSRFKECLVEIWTQIIYFLSFFSLDIPSIMLFFIFYATYYRLRALRKFIKNKECRIKEIQLLYKSLIDSTETIKIAFDPIFLINLVANIPMLMIVIYQIIKEIKMDMKPPIGYVTEIISVASLVITIFAPTIPASNLSSEVDKIKLILHNMMFEDRDEKQLQDIQRLIHYIEARPFKFRVLKIIPMDVTLPLIITNLSITYIIVLLQLTHLY